MDLHLQDMVLQEIIVVKIQEFMVIKVKVMEKIISIILREMLNLSLKKSMVGRLGAMMLIIQLQLQIIIII